MSPEKKAALWHWGDVGITGLAFVYALAGLIGHFLLRREYRRWHQSRDAR